MAPFLVYMVCFLALAVPGALETVPEGVVNGILTYVGLAGQSGTALPRSPVLKLPWLPFAIFAPGLGAATHLALGRVRNMVCRGEGRLWFGA